MTPLKVGKGTAPLAAIDIGSNSIKLRVARRNGGRTAILLDTTEICHLGRGFVDGCIPEETLANAARVVTEMVSCARDLGAERIRLVGTMALRSARNAGDFLSRIYDATGLDVQVISGDEEARYSWKGAVAGLGFDADPGNLVMFDTGGGSTEFVWGQSSPDSGVAVKSVPVGAVTLTERFFGDGPASQSALDAAVAHVKGLLAEYDIACRSPAPTVVGLGGGVVAIASVKRGQDPFIPMDLHGMTLTRRDLKQQIRLYSLLTLEERRNVIGLPPSRADVILASACIVLCALEALNVPSCALSINGLRHGVLLEMFEEELNEKNPSER